MNIDSVILEWNRLFISLVLRIGEIYFRNANMTLTLDSLHKEERWKWADEGFVEDSLLLYRFLLSHQEERKNMEVLSFEGLVEGIRTSPCSPLPSPGEIKSNSLRKYIGHDFPIKQSQREFHL